MNNGDMPSNPIIDGDTGTVSSADGAWDHSDPLQCIGLTKRERFAMAAMQGIITLMPNESIIDHEAIADDACRCADALLSELERTTND